MYEEIKQGTAYSGVLGRLTGVTVAVSVLGMLMETVTRVVVGTTAGMLAGTAAAMLEAMAAGMAVEMAVGTSAGRFVGITVEMTMLAGPIPPREVVAEMTVAGISPSLGGVADRAAVISVVPVLLLRSPAAEELATSAVGELDMASISSLLGTDESTAPPGDIVVVSSEFPAVAVTASAGELVVWVGF
jgi:hypothetical protein